jgi:hypothetical protein
MMLRVKGQFRHEPSNYELASETPHHKSETKRRSRASMVERRFGSGTGVS